MTPHYSRLACLLAPLLTACGGGGSDEAPLAAPDYSLTVTLSEAGTLCVNLNQNASCDAGEPSVSGAAGTHRLSGSAPTLLTSPLLFLPSNPAAPVLAAPRRPARWPASDPQPAQHPAAKPHRRGAAPEAGPRRAVERAGAAATGPGAGRPLPAERLQPGAGSVAAGGRRDRSTGAGGLLDRHPACAGVAGHRQSAARAGQPLCPARRAGQPASRRPRPAAATALPSADHRQRRHHLHGRGRLPAHPGARRSPGSGGQPQQGAAALSQARRPGSAAGR